MKKIKLTDNKILFTCMFFSLLLLLLIPSIRLLKDKPIFPEDHPYYHLKMSEYIKEEGLPVQEPLIGRPYIPQPYHLILAITNPFLGSLIIPLLCGIISLILFYLILKELNLNPLKITTILLTLILSPIFIFLFSVSNQYTLTITLILAGFLFFIKDKKYFIPSLIIFASIPFFGILPSIFSILLLLAYSINNKEKTKYFFAVFSSVILILLAYQIPLLYHYGFPNSTKLINPNILINLLSDLGSTAGYGTFAVLLSFVGLYYIWKQKKYIITYALFFLLAMFSFFIPEIYIYLGFIVPIFAGFGLFYIIKKKWKVDLIKTLTIILIVCGLLFSTLSYINNTSNSLPDQKTIKSLNWLRENSATTDKIFSHHSKGLWIQTISSRPVVLDSRTYYIDAIKEKLNDSNTTFYSRNLEKTRSILDKYNIKYIYIDEKMKQGQVWTREQQGILFLFRNNKTFKKVYNRSSIEIWEYLKQND
ncbi:hypothetical protein GF361_04245 [Candidatus Woesearchaeota archaeon]|nr:hypothetical protein [Candidatus Woesearchaeota archaeon]